MKSSATLFILSAIVASALAKTDLAGCTQTVAQLQNQAGYTTFYWNPEVREQCSILDCGGGRAPPKSNVPGCPLYTGTEPVAVTGWPAEATPYELDAPPAPEAPAPTPAPDVPSPPSPTPDTPASSDPPPAEGEEPATSSNEGSSSSPSSSSPSSRRSGMATITSSPVASRPVVSPASASATDADSEANDTGSAARSFFDQAAAVAAALAFLVIA